MKIVKRVGEQLPPWLTSEIRPVLAFTGMGRALAVGSHALARRTWDALGDRLNTWERLAAVGFTGYATVYCCQQAPHIAEFAIPGAVAAWCAAAWWIAPAEHPADRPEEPDEEQPTTVLIDPHQLYAQWLLDLIGDQPGIHLRDLYPRMRDLPGQERHTDADLRAALKTLDVPVHRSLRIGTVAGRSGVRRDDVEALLHRLGERHVEFAGDAGQTVDSPPGEPHGEQLESA